MKTIFTVFRKELGDSLRDRRTLVAMVFVPLILFPVMISISSTMLISHAKKAQEKVLKIGVVANGGAKGFVDLLASKSDVELVEGLTVEEGPSFVRSDSLDAFIVFDAGFDETVAARGAGPVTLYYKSTESSGIEKRRVRELLSAYEDSLRRARFEALSLDVSIVDAIHIAEQNLASAKEQLADELGGFLPYLIIIFCFTGAMYPAIDLAAGEKERGTLETLLTSPAGRLEILIGKFGVVVLTGIASALVSIVGMYIGIRRSPEIPPEALNAILGMLEPGSIAMLLSLLLPLTVFFAAILLSLSFFAKSFKEAQSTITPLMIFIIVPAFIGLMPGMTLDAKTALIPILNVSLATKAIIAGSVAPGLLFEVYASLIVLAALGMWVCVWVFNREDVIFRSA
ncbi:MAG: transporter permease [Candidatus Krumholzibacteriota bacterium]|nr:transporter permease [Candidatus Krumholzibacteriota bacterium]